MPVLGHPLPAGGGRAEVVVVRSRPERSQQGRSDAAPRRSRCRGRQARQDPRLR